MSLDDDLRELAAVQYALVSVRQAQAMGATKSGLRSRRLGPDWESVTARVLRLVGAPRGARQLLMLGVLDAGPGAAVSFGAGAFLWRLPGFPLGTVEVSRPRSRSTCAVAAAIAHHPRLLPPHHVTECHGIPVTTLARTVFDVSTRLRPARLERLVDTVVARSPSALAALHATAADLRACGRRGSGPMRAVLSARPPGYVAPASGLEARFDRILAEGGEPPLDRQVDVGGHEWIGRVDFVDRSLRIIVEVDSDLHHTSLLDRAADARRDEALRRAGWVDVVRVCEDEVWRRPHEAVAKVRAARRRARRLLVSDPDPGGSRSDTRAS
ncbi:MAG TPA: DUF559 domain-containing protein [Acidimicrobiales bacterium]|nr:DUF559 domain-containing protein [Acidimicrobiales bacterium]